MKTIDLSGKTAIVTGSSQGIGRATALALHEAGANVVINYFEDGEGKNRELAEGVVAELANRAIAVAANVTGDPLRPVTFASTVWAPERGPRVNWACAIPSVPVVGVAGLTAPPPAVAANVTASPATALPN